MPGFTVQEILEATGGTLMQTGAEKFSDIVTDTRKVGENTLFVALKGERFDGHDFVATAAAGGAAGVVVSRDIPPVDAAVIRVSDTLAAYQSLARFHRNRFQIPVLAVTGSNGKTTTKDILAAILSAKLQVLKTKANYNNEIGLPLTLLELAPSHQAAVVEMGMRGLGQIAQLAAIACPTIGIVTNVGETHMELLGSIEAIARAKSELIQCLPDHSAAVLNADDPHVRAMARFAKGRVILFGWSQEADVRVVDVWSEGVGTAFCCSFKEQRTHFRLPLAGRHNVANALAAIAAALALGLTMEEIKRGLAAVQPSRMRLSIEKYETYTVLNDAYNASPASTYAALTTLKEVAAGRCVAVFGDMLELGEISQVSHEAVGRQMAELGVSVVVTLGEMAQYTARAAEKAGCPVVKACLGHLEAAEALKKVIQKGDTILFKGSRGMKMEKIIECMGFDDLAGSH